MSREHNPKSVKVSAMNDAVRAAINARLHEKKMSRADLARATGLRPQAVTRALNGAEGGGTVPPAWAAMLDALGMTITAVPVEHLGSGEGLALPPAPAPRAADPEQLAQHLEQLAQAVRGGAALGAAGSSTPSPAAPAEPGADEPGSAGGVDSPSTGPGSTP